MFAFLLAPLGRWIALGVVVVVIVGVGYFYVHHLQGKVADLEKWKAEATLKFEVIEKAQAATEKARIAQAKVRKRNVQDNQEMTDTVASGDRPHLRDLYGKYGMSIPGGGSPASGQSSGAGNISPRPANPAPLHR